MEAPESARLFEAAKATALGSRRNNQDRGLFLSYNETMMLGLADGLGDSIDTLALEVAEHGLRAGLDDVLPVVGVADQGADVVPPLVQRLGQEQSDLPVPSGDDDEHGEVLPGSPERTHQARGPGGVGWAHTRSRVDGS